MAANCVQKKTNKLNIVVTVVDSFSTDYALVNYASNFIKYFLSVSVVKKNSETKALVY